LEEIHDFVALRVYFKALSAELVALFELLAEESRSREYEPQLLILSYFKTLQAVIFAVAELGSEDVQFGSTHVQIKQGGFVCRRCFQALVETMKCFLTVFFFVLTLL
jgi:hypothetical protein